MLIIFFAESSKLCLKDLSSDVTVGLSLRLQADDAALEKFYQFFGLKMGGWYQQYDSFPLEEIKKMFPDTTVSVLKECFEVLRLYDLVEILEKVKPRSLRPAVSREQIEKLRRTDDRPTKYHSNVAVLIVDITAEVEREDAEKIETFFKDLNSQNEVATISLASSQETRKFLREVRERNVKNYDFDELRLKTNLESVLKRKARLEKELEMETKEGRKQRESGLELRQLEQLELRFRGELEVVAKEKKQTGGDVEKLKELKELEKENEKSLSTAMDELIHNQGWLTSRTYIQVYSNHFVKGVLMKLSSS